MTPSEIDLAIFGLVAQRLKQLRRHVPHAYQY
jgi:hypothetical protein